MIKTVTIKYDELTDLGELVKASEKFFDSCTLCNSGNSRTALLNILRVFNNFSTDPNEHVHMDNFLLDTPLEEDCIVINMGEPKGSINDCITIY